MKKITNSNDLINKTIKNVIWNIMENSALLIFTDNTYCSINAREQRDDNPTVDINDDKSIEKDLYYLLENKEITKKEYNKLKNYYSNIRKKEIEKRELAQYNILKQKFN